jgi:1,4-alpha-glucan branching enzyme
MRRQTRGRGSSDVPQAAKSKTRDTPPTVGPGGRAARDDRGAAPLSVMPPEWDALVAGDCVDPHAVLGAHPECRGTVHGVCVRAFHPDATAVEALPAGDAPVALERVHPGGLFAAFLPGRSLPFDYRLRFHFTDGSVWEREDPYRFLPTLGPLDEYLFAEGSHRELYARMGAHCREIEGTAGVAFAVWAPNARRVSLVGDFNRWDGRLFPMRCLGVSGIWEIFVPGLAPGALYKFEIKTADGDLRLKTDPFAFMMERPPGTATRVVAESTYAWGDGEWMHARPAADPRRGPMAIYEVHLGSWMRVPEEGNRPLTYREIAPKLAAHAREYGFTHIQLMPIAEYPFEGSWGYQVTGYFAPTSRYGTPDDLRYLVDTCHQHGIGVLLDWVPAHFPKDDFALRRFDGSALYEHADPRQGEHPEWGTLVFNYGRNEVRNFLIANALYWLDRFHVDGLRVDAVASMLYLDYSRAEGEWVPNPFGGRENLEAAAFLRRLNELVYGLFPGVVTIAEESTAFPAVTAPTYLGGLGFGFKWDMGWMNDTLAYMRHDPVHRRYHHERLTFGMLYAYSENFILPLSHDEVVYGKRSLLGKMPGDRWQQFANLRLLLAYLYTRPGKKLLFMGTELAPDGEWDHDASLNWHLASDAARAGLQRFLRDLAAFYRSEPALWQNDVDPAGFAWIDCHDHASSVISYLRRAVDGPAPGRTVVCVFNFTPVPRHGYRVGFPEAGYWRERENSDAALYGGSNLGNAGAVVAEPIAHHGQPASAALVLPPLAALVFDRG